MSNCRRNNNLMTLVECIECGKMTNEFPSADYAPVVDLEFECPACDFGDKLLAGQSVEAYAKEFELRMEEIG